MKICPKCLKQYEDAFANCPEDGTELRSFNDDAIRLSGKILDGRWLIEKKIGEGGMGEVYRGRQVSVDRPVAVKVLRPAMAVSEEYVSRFFREANMASHINHPNFVTIYDFGQAEGLQILYLAMEFLDGQDLADRMTEGRMGLQHILQIASQCCGALTAAHKANIVHRDLKPENIFLIGNGPDIQLKVLDFGIAKEIGATGKSMTRTGQIFGTPEYMSPEQCQSMAEIDGRSDLYSLGCIMYELISGRSPFLRDSVIQTLLAQVSEEIRDLRTYRFSIPDSLATIVMRLLEKDRDDRYASAEEAKAVIDAELERVMANPGELENYLDSHRSTYDYDRQVDSSAFTEGFEYRPTSQLIDLDALGGLDELAPSRSSGLFAKALLGLVLMGAGVAVAATQGVFEPEPDVANIEPAVDVSSYRLLKAANEARVHTIRLRAERTATDVVVFVTSVALAPKKAASSGKSPSTKRRRPKATTNKALLGVRTPTSIESRARKYQRKLVACYGQREDMSAGGKVTVRFRIRKDGSVDNVKVTKAAFKSPAMETCLIEKIGGWKFAQSTQGSGVNYHERSFVFNPPK